MLSRAGLLSIYKAMLYKWSSPASMPPRPENGITWRTIPEGCLRFYAYHVHVGWNNGQVWRNVICLS